MNLVGIFYENSGNDRRNSVHVNHVSSEWSGICKNIKKIGDFDHVDRRCTGMSAHLGQKHGSPGPRHSLQISIDDPHLV
ncbi:hypothetical protein Enr10x_60810 [Gimesia panareensis]|uniref:Uncharacterized protein n=1 Tax=Gimesia panareensis TaxID=2527978 RepID=A0A517QGF0_9PLAN|nr:hypothetical protein Enr10x_60810 [Gimesia panareensis]